jgi:hypothetical protein
MKLTQHASQIQQMSGDQQADETGSDNGERDDDFLFHAKAPFEVQV